MFTARKSFPLFFMTLAELSFPLPLSLFSAHHLHFLLLRAPCFIFYIVSLKGQCHKSFCFWFFSRISFSPAPEYPIRTISNFFENSQRYLQVKVHHWYQRHRWQICTGVNDTGGKIADSINHTGGKLPPVSTTPGAKFATSFACVVPYRWQICRRCQQC